MGMPAEEFWHGDPSLAAGYREAWRMRMQSAYKAEWREGLYVANAIAACFGKDSTYPEEPLFTMESPEEVEARKAMAAMERMKAAFISRVEKIAAEKG